MSTGIRYKETHKECSSVIQAMGLTAGQPRTHLDEAMKHLLTNFLDVVFYSSPDTPPPHLTSDDRGDSDTRAP